MLVAAALITPVGGSSVVKVLGDPVALLAGVGVGISSSVIPYVTELVAVGLVIAGVAIHRDPDERASDQPAAGAVAVSGAGAGVGGSAGAA